MGNPRFAQAKHPCMKTIGTGSLLLLVAAQFSLGQAPADPSPEKAAVLANDKAYESAYAKGDVKAMVDFFAEDAEYTADDGRTFSGRNAIEEAIRAGLAGNRDSRLSIQVDSVRLLAPETLVERGFTTVAAKAGEINRAQFTAVHVKRDGKWKIHQLVETPVPVSGPAEHLTELQWLVGKWEESDPSNDLTISSQYQWARGGSFLTRSVTVKRAGQVTLEGWQIIGWDPIEEKLRSWTFDGEGGFSEGRFTREGERWLLREKGVASDGTRTSADNTISKLSGDKFTWESNNRTLDGDPQPSIGRVEIQRVKGD